MGFKLRNKGSIGSYFFARLQVASRKYHEPKKPLYANVFRLQQDSNVATIWLNSTQDEIQVVIQGKGNSSI